MVRTSNGAREGSLAEEGLLVLPQRLVFVIHFEDGAHVDLLGDLVAGRRLWSLIVRHGWMLVAVEKAKVAVGRNREP